MLLCVGVSSSPALGLFPSARVPRLAARLLLDLAERNNPITVEELTQLVGEGSLGSSMRR